MPKRFLAPLITRLADEAVDRVVRNLDERIRELAGVRISRGALVESLELANATEVPINHGLGHRAKWALCGMQNPSSSGRVEEVVSGSVDRKNSLILKATGYGATVTVDVWVF